MTRSDNLIRLTILRATTDPHMCPVLTAVHLIGVEPPKKEGGKPAVTNYAAPVACVGSSCAWWSSEKNGCDQGPDRAGNARPVEQTRCGCGDLGVALVTGDCARCGRPQGPRA